MDVWASLEGKIVAVQCKRWEGAVGEPVLRDLYGTLTAAKAYSGCLITTGTFTAQAYEFARGKPLHLINMETLLGTVKSPLRLRELVDCL